MAVVGSYRKGFAVKRAMSLSQNYYPASSFPAVGWKLLVRGDVYDRACPRLEVRAEGTGLDTSVTVGRQTISFDGEKIVLAK